MGYSLTGCPRSPTDSQQGSLGYSRNYHLDVTELTFRQRLELSMKASQCPFFPAITPPSDADRQLQAAIKTEMTLFSTTGRRGRCLQLAFNYLMTVHRRPLKQREHSQLQGFYALSYARRWEITLLTLYAFLDHITVTVRLNVMKLRQFNH